MDLIDNPLQLLRDRHNLDLPDNKLQEIVHTCAEIIVMQEYVEAQQGNLQAAIDLGWVDEKGEEIL